MRPPLDLAKGYHAKTPSQSRTRLAGGDPDGFDGGDGPVLANEQPVHRVQTLPAVHGVGDQGLRINSLTAGCKTTALEMRPRSEIWWPFCRAHARIAESARGRASAAEARS